jgi:hypothetical protein
LSSQDIIKSLNHWLSAFSQETSKALCSLYDEEASLWGTLSPIKRESAALIKDYFDHIFTFEKRSVELINSNVRIFGDIAICNGSYTFSWFIEDIKVTTEARFSFVYINKNGQWLIIEHHSSPIP